MADNDNTIGKTVKHILTLKDQVLKWAPPKEHNSDTGEYGKANSTDFGHVKLKDILEEEEEHPVTSSAIATYVNNKISTLKTEITNIIIKTSIEDDAVDSTIENNKEKYNIPTTKAVLDRIKLLQSKINIKQTINNNSEHKDTNDIYNIPTSKAVWDTISNELKAVDYRKPQIWNGNINNLTTAGYYLMQHDEKKPKSFSYGGETIYYTNALVTVKKYSNRVIQHVCATTKVTSSTDANTYTYKINGSEYTRYGSYKSDGTKTWRPWHVAHKPYSKTSRAKVTDTAHIDKDSIVVYENTAGFIIQWKQTGDSKKYPITAPLYEYKDICTFSPALPINGPYVFGNLIGRMDIRITSTKMQIRSNVAPGGRIIGMEETYFVPRNQ